MPFYMESVKTPQMNKSYSGFSVAIKKERRSLEQLSGAEWRAKLSDKDWAEMCDLIKKEFFMAWFSGRMPWPIPEGRKLMLRPLPKSRDRILEKTGGKS